MKVNSENNLIEILKKTECEIHRKNAFYTETINPKEMGFLEKFESEKTQNLKLPKWWRVGDTLRHAYANDFNIKKTKKVKKKILKNLKGNKKISNFLF